MYLKVGQKAPDFSLPDYYDNMGRSKFVLKDDSTPPSTPNWIYNTPYNAPAPQWQ